MVGTTRIVMMADGSRQATWTLTMLANGVRAECKASLQRCNGFGM